MTERARTCVPLPHVALQGPQKPQLDVAQCTGHATFEQSRVSSRMGQALPPCATSVVMTRTRCWLPPPQVVVQAPYKGHADTSQSVGHLDVAQVSDSDSDGHASPLNWASITTMRRRSRVLPPHVAPHGPHEDKLEVTQCTGHGIVLHACCSLSAGHSLPLYCASTMIARSRTAKPPPHCALQLP
jgi:hypothetical protein